MADEKFTRSPSCATVYRVTPEQLAVRGGQVRCGQCRTIFDGVAQQIGHTPPEDADADDDVAVDVDVPPSATVAVQEAESQALPVGETAATEQDRSEVEAVPATTTTLEERLAGPRRPPI